MDDWVLRSSEQAHSAGVAFRGLTALVDTICRRATGALGNGCVVHGAGIGMLSREGCVAATSCGAILVRGRARICNTSAASAAWRRNSLVPTESSCAARSSLWGFAPLDGHYWYGALVQRPIMAMSGLGATGARKPISSCAYALTCGFSSHMPPDLRKQRWQALVRDDLLRASCGLAAD